MLKATPESPDLLALLARGCEVFPESARLAAEFGSALIRAGRDREGWEQQARAMAMLRAGNGVKEEFGEVREAPLSWELAGHILRACNG